MLTQGKEEIHLWILSQFDVLTLCGLVQYLQIQTTDRDRTALDTNKIKTHSPKVLAENVNRKVLEGL